MEKEDYLLQMEIIMKQILCEPEFKNVKPNGFGKENLKNNYIYEGNFINGIREEEYKCNDVVL